MSLVTVATFTSPWDAHIARGLLESEGVPCGLSSEHHIWVNWPLSQALGGVRLEVSDGWEQRALEILGARDAGEFEIALEREAALPAAECPRCKSRRARPVRSLGSSVAAVVSTVVFGAPFPPAIEGKECTICGARHEDVL